VKSQARAQFSESEIKKVGRALGSVRPLKVLVPQIPVRHWTGSSPHARLISRGISFQRLLSPKNLLAKSASKCGQAVGPILVFLRAKSWLSVKITTGGDTAADVTANPSWLMNFPSPSRGDLNLENRHETAKTVFL